MMECYRPGTPKCRNYLCTWTWMYGWTSSGKEVAPWGQVCTDYTGGKVTVCSLLRSLTKIRGKFKLCSLLKIQYMSAYYFKILAILGISATVLDRMWPGLKNPFLSNGLPLSSLPTTHTHPTLCFSPSLDTQALSPHILQLKKANLPNWLEGGATAGRGEAGRGWQNLQEEGGRTCRQSFPRAEDGRC